MRWNSSPWKPWNVSSMTCGERLSHRSSMSMRMNACKSGALLGEVRETNWEIGSVSYS